MRMKFVVIALAVAISLVTSLPDSVRADEAVGHQVFFRGGAAFLTSDRSGEVFTDVFGRNNQRNDSKSGYYVGGGLDLVLSKDVWGMMSKTWALGEIGVEYKSWNSKVVTVAVPSTCAGALGPAAPGCTVQNGKVHLTMLTVSIAPKIKFMEGSRFRPWIIPIGLDFDVISPPSNDTSLTSAARWARASNTISFALFMSVWMAAFTWRPARPVRRIILVRSAPMWH